MSIHNKEAASKEIASCFLYLKNYCIYQYKDHLGNARISFARNSAGALEITDANDYYPFGMNHLKTGNAFFGNASYKNYKFQEQELQETGFYSFFRASVTSCNTFVLPLGVEDNTSEEYPYFSTYFQ